MSVGSLGQWKREALEAQVADRLVITARSAAGGEVEGPSRPIRLRVACQFFLHPLVVIIGAAVDALRKSYQQHRGHLSQHRVVIGKSLDKELLHVYCVALHKRSQRRACLELVQEEELIVAAGHGPNTATVVANGGAFQKPTQEVCRVVLLAKYEIWSLVADEIGKLVRRVDIHLDRLGAAVY